MRFSTLLFPSIAAAAALSKRSSGCNITLESTLSSPPKAGEEILYKTIIKWSDSTGESLDSSAEDWTNTAAAPFSIYFYADEGNGNLSYIESVLDTWLGTWLISTTTTPNSNSYGDYNITSVTCA